MYKECSSCKQTKETKNFAKEKNVKSGYSNLCKSCKDKYHRERAKIYYERDPEKFKKRNREWWARNVEKTKLIRKKTREKARMETLDAYSGGKLECACCGEKTYQFLALDHVNNDGYIERKNGYWGKHGSGGNYHYLKKRGFPNKDRYQVLCHNCNCAKGFYGACPHENRKRKLNQ